MKKLLGLAPVLCALVGCHIYRPLITHEINEEKFKPGMCPQGLTASASLKRACLTRSEIEDARREHEDLNGATSTVLIPGAGYVAYRAARQQSGAGTGAFAAGGLAAYATVGRLAPDGRIEAYTRASRSLTCAIGAYGLAEASVPPALIERVEYNVALQDSKRPIEEDKEAFKAKAPKNPTETEIKGMAKVANVERFVDTLDRHVRQQSAMGGVDALLDQFVGQTIEDLNNLLRGTLPTLADLATQVAALSNSAPQGGTRDQIAIETLGFTKEEMARYELATLIKAAQALVKTEAGQRATADFTPCQMSTAALSAQGLYKPLMLGPGNSLQGQSIDLKPGETYTAPIVGGLAPLSFAVGGSDPADFRPTVEITMQGAALLKVTIGKQDKTAHTYRVTVYDSAGANRWFDVVVPKGP